jgi:hypothetical protein
MRLAALRAAFGLVEAVGAAEVRPSAVAAEEAEDTLVAAVVVDIAAAEEAVAEGRVEVFRAVAESYLSGTLCWPRQSLESPARLRRRLV